MIDLETLITQEEPLVAKLRATDDLYLECLRASVLTSPRLCLLVQ